MAGNNISTLDKKDADSVVPFPVINQEEVKETVEKLNIAANAGNIRATKTLEALKYFNNIAASAVYDEKTLQNERASLRNSLFEARKNIYLGYLMSRAGLSAGQSMIQAGQDKINTIGYLSQLIVDNPRQYIASRQAQLLTSASAYLQTLAPALSMLPGDESGFTMQQMQQYAKETSSNDQTADVLSGYTNMYKSAKDDKDRAHYSQLFDNLADALTKGKNSGL